VPTDFILETFSDYISDDFPDDEFNIRKDQIKQLLKRLAFFDKSDKVWIMRD